MKLSRSLLLAAFVIGARAQECSLSVITVGDNGKPVPGIPITVTEARAFRGGQSRSGQTDAAGTFSATGLACGKYMVMARVSDPDPDPRFPGFVNVDIKKQSKIELKVPNADPLLSLLYEPPDSTESPEMAVARANAILSQGSAAPHAGLVEDAKIATQRRAFFEQLSAKDLPVFDATAPLEQRKMFVMAYAQHVALEHQANPVTVQQAKAQDRDAMMKQFSSGARFAWSRPKNNAPMPVMHTHQEEDLTAQLQLGNAAAIVRNNLSAEDAGRFAQADELERAQLFVRALAAQPKHPAGCGMFAFYLSDMEAVSPSANAASYFVPMGLLNWNSLDMPGRCAAIDDVAVNLLATLRKLANDDSIDTLKAAVARSRQTLSDPKTVVLRMFGENGLQKYKEARDTDRKLQLFRAATLMELGWNYNYMAS